jgi:hypothetical protein
VRGTHSLKKRIATGKHLAFARNPGR